MSDTSSPYKPRCMHLCCKSMIAFGEAFESDPDFQAGMVEFWCQQTGKGQGPDGSGLSLELCSEPKRSCFQEY